MYLRVIPVLRFYELSLGLRHCCRSLANIQSIKNAQGLLGHTSLIKTNYRPSNDGEVAAKHDKELNRCLVGLLIPCLIKFATEQILSVLLRGLAYVATS